MNNLTVKSSLLWIKIILIGLVSGLLSLEASAQRSMMSSAENFMDSNRNSRDIVSVKNVKSVPAAEEDADNSDVFIREMKPVFTSEHGTFYFILHEAATLEIRLFNSRGNAISSTVKKVFEAGCAILEIPMTMPEDNEIVCCLKLNGKKLMKTFRHDGVK